MWESKDDPVTMSYCSPSNIDNMHKVRQFTPLMTGTVGNQLHNKYLTAEWLELISPDFEYLFLGSS